MQEIDPEVTPDTIMPATLCKDIMTGLLRDELGFNGMVVTDASHMVGMTNRMKRKDMLPAAINAGCDMFLFFNDPAEDFETMLNAYNTGIISEERMVEALSRILGLKAAKGMHKMAKEALCGTDEELAAALNNPEFKAIAPAVSKDALTLVKYKDEGVLPITPEKYKRIMLVNIKGAETPMGKLMALAMKNAAAARANAADRYVYGLFSEAGSSITDGNVTAETIVGHLIDARTKLFAKNVADASDIVIEVSPEIAGLILTAKVNLATDNQEALENGFLGSIGGCKIFVSNNIQTEEKSGVNYHKCIARTKRAIAYADQLSEIVAYRPEKRFADAVKGLHLYGAKVVYPNEMVVLDMGIAKEA